ncbi:uncharacterized protein P174DRAFT_434355 [Aspergillus novofumigatus IBT 16806]|uniref:Uncharacterized protein n=1 Tax=Aspergillus novofumigatus (strain IBT 16806) TaxID=1392255 RepID=A0A2I1BS69_ASPN1|nr:uncharacterized protein P174DRAFT_436294 [Aspergillus novofumigatus IBT 16806]XP_024678511.1 uncharacterized protein P174DRAFT_434355 [Aspergillus novofumigatus IBT 16806]PKX88228.1 hypothetical protein P174DRAFT_436294 [Aspergillus novofumigatus IBT 16806]PKX89916.1 hypothetical protein P174DRAFT_434355 [Aspergillus novofumigatus IBT 16806]
MEEAAEHIALVITGVATVLINLADGDLDGGVVVGPDDVVSGAALAVDAAIRKEDLKPETVQMVKESEVVFTYRLISLLILHLGGLVELSLMGRKMENEKGEMVNYILG